MSTDTVALRAMRRRRASIAPTSSGGTNHTPVTKKLKSSTTNTPTTRSSSRPKSILADLSPNNTSQSLGVVMEEEGKTSLNRNERQQQPKESILTLQTVQNTLHEWFDGTDRATDIDAIALLEKPCISARLFACYRLLSRRSSNNNDTCKNPKPSSTVTKLFEALIRVELLQLGNHTPRRVHFATHDGSGTHPPVDRDPDSAQHQTDCIEAYDAVKQLVNSLTRSDLDMLVQVWTFFEQLDPNSLAPLLPSGCSPSRTRAVIEMHKSDFATLVRRVQRLPSLATTPLSSRQALLHLTASKDEPALSFETTLAYLVGQKIRYQLRMFFNAAPPRLSTVNEEYDAMAESAYSKVISKVSFSMVDGETSTVVEDACISALVSSALRALYEFFGMDVMLGLVEPESRVPQAFCASDISLVKLPIRSRDPYTLSEKAFHTVVDDIQEASSFLTAARGARFLVDLWCAPGVDQEIERMGGWSEIETYASMSWRYDLHTHCSEDAHLVALCNIESLLAVLRGICQTAEPRVDDCQESLGVVKTNYRLTTKSKNLLNRFPFIKSIAAVYEDAMALPESFPHVDHE